jgi:hypothetical protein
VASTVSLIASRLSIVARKGERNQTLADGVDNSFAELAFGENGTAPDKFVRKFFEALV